jgi:hypothetical protein
MTCSRCERPVCLSARPTNKKPSATRLTFVALIFLLTILSLCKPSSAQSGWVGKCRPVSERTSEVGCWIIAHQPMGQLAPQTFWHLDVYSTRAEAEAAKGPRGTVVESLGKSGC